MKPNANKVYLGDSVYVTHDGYMLTLTTENGEGPTNTIHLEPQVWFSLCDYVDALARKVVEHGMPNV